MPIFNLFKNCTYYWGFAAFVSYFVNHPLYTAPAEMQSVVCLVLAMLCQLGNFRRAACARPACCAAAARAVSAGALHALRA
jgi:hypothetical protein